jgi:hypothetical protein
VTRVLAVVLPALLVLAAIGGCGESDPKRSVDASTEVLHFYADSAPVVGLLRTQPSRELERFDRAAAGLPMWRRIRSQFLGPLQAAGLDMSDLGRLVQPREEIEDFEASAMSFGAPTPTDLEAGQTLTVIATDQDELLDELLREGVESGQLQPQGDLDEAELYGNSVAAYAERDGVLISAPSLGVVRAAIARRDGDSDEQLDEDVVSAALQELQQRGPVTIYANVPQLTSIEEIQQLFPNQTISESAVDGAASLLAEGRSPEIEVAVELEEDIRDEQSALDEEPVPIGLLIPGLGAVRGVGSVSSDEVQLQLRPSGSP